MKKFAKLLVVALAVAIIASMFSVVASATEAPAAETDPNNLKPGSERVIFIKDAPRDENYQIVGELTGDGTGSDADNPLIPMDHEEFDPGAEYPKYHLQTAFYQATEMLKDTGGTIVIVGPVFFGFNECWGNGSSVKDTFTANFGNNVIKFTSVWDGVDYRETAGAKITIDTPAMLSILGSSIWENIDIETVGTERAITFDEYATLIGEGVECYPADEAFTDVAQNYISLAGGHRYAKSVGENPTLLVKSGTYNKIVGGLWGTVASADMQEATVNLTLEGTTRVLGQIFGSTRGVSNFGGNITITINSGTYECDINGVGSTGMLNTDGTVKIIIKDGDFRNAWSINNAAMGYTNNAPAIAELDFSAWTGELYQLGFAKNVITEGFTEVKYPAGVTEQQIADAVANAPDAPTPIDTEPVETEPTTPDATEPVADVTEPVADATEPQKDDEKESETVPENNNGGNGGINPVIFIVIGIVVVVAVVVVLVIVLGKKKKA